MKNFRDVNDSDQPLSNEDENELTAPIKKARIPFNLSPLSDEQKQMILAESNWWDNGKKIFDSPEFWPSPEEITEWFQDRHNPKDQLYMLLNLLIEYNPRNDAGPELDELMRWVALINDTPQTLQLLLDRGANVDSRAENGRTALMYAASCGHLQNVRVLLENNADVNALDDPFNTALALAAAGECEKLYSYAHEKPDRTPEPYIEPICRLLLQYGAQVNTTDNQGNSPLANAALSGQVEICKMLLAANAQLGNINKLLRQATYGNVEFLCQQLLNLRADPHASDMKGNTAVHIALYQGYLALLKLFSLKQTPTWHLDSLLCLAARNHGSEELCQFFLDEGGYVNAKHKSYYLDNKANLLTTLDLFSTPLVNAIES